MKVTFAIFTLIAAVFVAAKEPAIYNNTKAYMVAIEAHLATLKDAEWSLQLQQQEAAKRDAEIAAREEAELKNTSEDEATTGESSEEEEYIEPPTYGKKQEPSAPPLEDLEDFESLENETTLQGHQGLDFDVDAQWEELKEIS